MLSEDFAFRGFSAASWDALLTLMGQRTREQKTARLVVVEAPDRSAIAAFTTTGVIVDVAEYKGRDDLGQLCKHYGCVTGIVVREGTVERVSRHTAQQTATGADLFDQVLPLLHALREAELQGAIYRYPPPTLVPLPTAFMLRKALDLILPDQHSLVFGVWEQGQLWTGMVLRRRAGLIDLCAGPDAISDWVGPLGGDFHRDHRTITYAVGRSVAPVHIGLYAERKQLEALLRNAEPGAWLKAVALREIVFDPAPPYVGAALGADAARATAQRARALLGGIDLLAHLQPYASAARSRLGPLGSITRALGFNPLHHLAARLADQDADRDS